MKTQARKSRLIPGTKGDWEAVIGMEVHAQVTSKAKLFSGASTEFGGEPNSHVSLVDAAMPGMLPVINAYCVEQAVRTGLGLKAQINKKSVFDRKNYFYPDLPQGYQISQYKSPVVGEGRVLVDTPDGEIEVGIERLHLEQDAGKSIHDQHPSLSLVDLNRSGVALMEIVSKPDLRSADDAKAYLVKLRAILRYLGTCDGDMEKGSLRADVNVSVRKPGGALGTRCEIKNMNSIHFIGQAIEHEARRQIEILEEGGKIEQETRLFDPAKRETRSMRTKEEAHDYRYFPDPDLLPLEFDDAFVAKIAASLPELPDEKRARFLRDYGIAKWGVAGISEYDAGVLVAEKGDADFFERMVSHGASPKAAANWIINVLKGQLNRADPLKLRKLIRPTEPTGPSVPSGLIAPSWSIGDTGPTGPAANTAILKMVENQTISGSSAKEVSEMMWKEALEKGPTDDPHRPEQIVQQRGMTQVTDTGAIEKAIDEIIAENPDKVADTKTKPQALGWFVGQVMKATGGKASPQAVNELLRRKLGIENFRTEKIVAEKKEVLFENRKRTRQQPLRPGERLFDYYDECGRNGYDEFRMILNHWLSEIAKDHRAELISRMQNAGNSAFGAALCELVIHALLVRLNQKIAVHPLVPGTKKCPDFAAIDERGKILCYVEVTTANRADEEEGELSREASIYNAVDRANVPAGCLLGYELIQAGSDSPPLGPFVKSIEHWARGNADRAQTEEVIERFAAGGWIIELELFSGGNAKSGTKAIGVATMRGGVISPQKDIRDALEGKSRRYGAMDAPYLIVVAEAKEQLFNEGHVKSAITEAVFGDEGTVFIGGKAKPDYAKNGFWIGRRGPQNQHVSAVLLLPKTGIWQLREKKWQPLLAINPWAKLPLPDSIKCLTRLEAEAGKWVLHDGRSFADILAIPTPWPPAD